MREEYKPELTTLGIAAAGVYGTGHGKWGDFSVTIPDNRLTPYLGDLVEGGMVIDKRPCVDRDDFVHMVVSGPMLKESLPSGHKEVFDFKVPRTVVPCSADDSLSGWDYIALDVYLEVWRRMGAKIGKRVGNAIQWESGEVFPIPPQEERYQHQEHG